MEVKVDGDGRGWKQSLRGRVGMGVISVPVQVSSDIAYSIDTMFTVPARDGGD